MMTPNQLSVAFTEGAVCQVCRKALRYPGQSPSLFFKETGNPEVLTHPRRYCCRIVPLNRQREDDRIENLRVLCPSCAATFNALTRPRPIHTRRRKYV